MNPRNPYAPPKAQIDQVRDTQCSRDGNAVVVRAGSDLPPRCIHCNAPVTLPTKTVKLYWHSPWLYLLILVNIVVYVIAGVIARRTVKVSPALCDVHAAKRMRRILVFVGLGGACIAAGIGMVQADQGGVAIVFFLLALSLLIFGSFAARKLHAKKITKDYARLGGCKEPFLASLEGGYKEPFLAPLD
jgi:hypothetical protein